MSGNNDDDKPEPNKIFPLDLASKLTVKPVEMPKGTPLVMTAQPFRGMRVLTQAAAATSTSVTGQTISIVPQGIIKSGETLRSTQLTGIISSHGQSQSSSGLTVSRPTQITLATSIVGQPQTTGTTYHVPRGPAVVANLATPRSAVATPIRTSGIATSSGQGSATGFGTTVRQVAPPRTPSPANTALPPGTTWLSSGGMQLQTGTATAQLMKNVVVGVGRAQPNQSTIPARQAVLHQAITLGQANTQIHSFKPTGSIQALGSTVTLAQVLPNRTQTLVYSGGGTQHFAASPRIAVTGTINSQRQVAATRPGQVMTTRLAVPVCMNQGSTRLTVTPATQGTIYTTGARISAVATPAQSTVIGATAARIAAVTSNTPHSAAATVSRLAAVTSPPGTLLTTAQTRLTVTNPAAAQQQQPSAVVIATQAGRLAASVVSLHPVVVGNTAQGARTIQTQGPKVITQQTQGPSIQLAQIPTVAKQTVLPVTVTVATAPTTRTINVAPAALLSQRPVAVSSSGQTIPIAKVFPQSNRNTLETGDVTVQQTNQPTNVYIHTTPMVRRPTSPGQVRTLQSQGEVQRTPVTTSVTTYSLSSGTTYYYDTSSGYTVAGGNLVARPFTQSTGSFAAVQQSATSTQIRPLTGIMSGQSIQFNPVMVVEQKRSTQFLDTTAAGGGLLQQSPLVSQQQQLQQQLHQQQHQQLQLQQQDHINPLPSIGKVTSSPRPSILRKRDNEGSPLKAAKNLAPVLASLSSAPASPPSRPDSRGGGVSSGGSTTISATSSPGLGEHEDSLPMPSNPPVQAAAVALKLEQQQLHLHHHHQQHHLHHHHHDDDKPTQEMSPRKKPRKQQLTGNDLHEPKFNMEDMQFISDSKMKKESENMHLHLHHHIMQNRELVPMTLAVSRTTTEVTVRKPAPASLLNSYRQTWKSTHNHYLRYTDIKPKDERRPTIIDLANQSHVLQTINGWKIHHLSSQMEDLADLETQVYERLSSELKLIETKDCEDNDREFNRINELIKGNMQRSKIINDSVVEAKTQVMKIFDHKENVADIITRCASKRNFKKREKF